MTLIPIKGTHVKLGSRRLHKDYLCGSERTTLCTVRIDDALVGTAFTHRWQCVMQGKSQQVCWITQLVVHKQYRGQGLAGGLLRYARTDSDEICGIISSHPAACLATAKSFGSVFVPVQFAPLVAEQGTASIERISLDFIRDHAADIIEASPVPYQKGAELCGTIFGYGGQDRDGDQVFRRPY